MKSKSPSNCICSSTSFRIFEKPSNLLKKKVEYRQCNSCGLIFVKESKNYDLTKIYNDNYFREIDTGWKGQSELILKFINGINFFCDFKKMQMCDFGAGNGYLTKSLLDSGYNVLAYEPYLGDDIYLNKNYYKHEPFAADILLMVEVFEHFTDAFNEIKKILIDFNYPKYLIFTTLLVENSNKNIIDWWYLNPDAGHFTIWSKKSLETLGNLGGYKLVSFSDFFHILVKKENNRKYFIIKFESIIYNLYIFLKKRMNKK